MMSFDNLRRALLWSTAINYLIILIWFAFFVLGHDWLYRFHGQWFHISLEHFDMLHYAGMSIYKIGILLFNLVPSLVLYIALRDVGR
jgi:hypothetical protein